jgi:chromosome partitioning protein
VLVFAVASQKGGSGKTTIATKLGVAAEGRGRPAVLLDLDPQATATVWKDWRGEAPPDVYAAQHARLPKLLEAAAANGAAVTILDTPPQADAIAQAAMRHADLVLIPCRPTAIDLQAITTTARAATQEGKPAFVVLNAVRPRSPLTEDAVRALGAAGIALAPVTVGDRADFQNPLSAGKAGIEWDPTGKAAAEIAALWDWITGLPATKAARIQG